MLLNTTKLKQSHPIAKHIPNYVWDLVFGSELDDNKVPRSQALSLVCLPEDMEQALVLLMICYPETPASQLLDIARKDLQLTDSSIFMICAAMDRVDCLDLFDSDQKEFLISESNFYNVLWAAASGASKALEWFETQLQSSEKIVELIKAEEFRMFRACCEFGQIDSLNWIMSKTETLKDAMLHKITYPVLSRILSKGHTNVVEWLKQQAPVKIDSMIKGITSNGYHQVLIDDSFLDEEMMSLLNIQGEENNETISTANLIAKFGVFPGIIVASQNGAPTGVDYLQNDDGLML